MVASQRSATYSLEQRTSRLRRQTKIAFDALTALLIFTERSYAKSLPDNPIGDPADTLVDYLDDLVVNHAIGRLADWDNVTLGMPSQTTAMRPPRISDRNRFAGAGWGSGRPIGVAGQGRMARTSTDSAKASKQISSPESPRASKSRRDMLLGLAGMLGAAAMLDAAPAKAGLADVMQRLRGARARKADIPQFNNSKCPDYTELRSPHVVEDFDIYRDLPGFYHELAFHDTTQFPLCPDRAQCTSTYKTVADPVGDQPPVTSDRFCLQCFGKYYPQTLQFQTTKEPGQLRASWLDAEITLGDTGIQLLPKGLFADVIWPNTIIDFKRGPEGWILEFQCVEWPWGGIAFIGINFYSKIISEQNFNEMRAAGEARGIDFYWNQGLGLTRVDHTSCAPIPPP